MLTEKGNKTKKGKKQFNPESKASNPSWIRGPCSLYPAPWPLLMIRAATQHALRGLHMGAVPSGAANPRAAGMPVGPFKP